MDSAALVEKMLTGIAAGHSAFLLCEDGEEGGWVQGQVEYPEDGGGVPLGEISVVFLVANPYKGEIPLVFTDDQIDAMLTSSHARFRPLGMDDADARDRLRRPDAAFGVLPGEGQGVGTPEEVVGPLLTAMVEAHTRVHLGSDAALGIISW